MSAAPLGVMGTRFKKSGKIFPADVVSLVSFVITGGYLHGILPGIYEPAVVIVVKRSNGGLVWSRMIDRRPVIIITSSGTVYAGLVVAWRSLSIGERGPLASPDLRDLPSDGWSRTSDFVDNSRRRT
ncbi:hypothetical protein AgCh_005229 [Apium graveolens]